MTRNFSLAVLLGLTPLTVHAAQQNPAATLTAQDRSEIQALAARYAGSLGGCAAEEYADLFVPQVGYFASNIRGEVVGRDRLMALVRSERHCTAASVPASNAPTAGTAAAPRAGNVPTVVIEPSSTGATGRADLGNAGHYEDEYTKTSNGWRFMSRTVVSRQEQAANLTARDMVAIRRLAGTDLGFFDDVYVAGADGVRRFRTSGVALGLSPEGVTGRALLKGDGGRYDDVYVRTAQGGWRFKARVYVADAPNATGAASASPSSGAAR